MGAEKQSDRLLKSRVWTKFRFHRADEDKQVYWAYSSYLHALSLKDPLALELQPEWDVFYATERLIGAQS